MAIKPGDVVMLKSGGQPMTVVGVDGDEIECVWIGEEGDFFRETLPAVALDRLELEDEDIESEEEEEDEEDEEDGQEEEEDEEEEEEEEKTSAKTRKKRAV